MYKKVKAIWGCLWLADGEVVQLDGVPYKRYTNIEQFGQQDLGDEANVYVEYVDDSTDTLIALDEVQEFFAR